MLGRSSLPHRISGHFSPSIPLILLILLGSRYYCTHFMDGKTEARKSSYLPEITLLGSWRSGEMSLGLSTFKDVPTSYS